MRGDSDSSQVGGGKPGGSPGQSWLSPVLGSLHLVKAPSYFGLLGDDDEDGDDGERDGSKSMKLLASDSC